MFKFGTSGIRDLTTNLLKNHIATELATKLSQMGWTELTIGRDGRKGSDKLMNEFVKNFPGKINNLGITTTPELAAQPGLAIMITASHNPCEYCGFKIYLHHQEQSTADLKPTPVYQKWEQLPRDIVIDCANGGLGHKLKTLGFTNLINTDGEINQGCGATHPENITQYCQENNLAIGFAVDGDADRCLIYLHDHVLASEEVAYLITNLLHLPRIVVDETVNSGLAKNCELVRAKVGGHNLIAAMRAQHIPFGAEKSGHYYFSTEIASSDALDAIILLANGYRTLGIEGLLKILKKYQPYYQFNQNIKIADLPANFEDTLANIALPKNVRQVIRKSGTEPLLRIMLEGKNKVVVDKAWRMVAAQLELK